MVLKTFVRLVTCSLNVKFFGRSGRKYEMSAVVCVQQIRRKLQKMLSEH